MVYFHGFGAVNASAVTSLISSLAPSYGVPTALALAVATRESGLNQSAVGSSGEKGVFQLMPGTARDLGVDPSDLAQNVRGGLQYLSQMYSRFGNWTDALEAYNGGPGNVSLGTVSGAAQDYARAVLAASGSLETLVPEFSLDLSASAADFASSEPAGLSMAAWIGLAAVGVGLVAVAVS